MLKEQISTLLSVSESRCSQPGSGRCELLHLETATLAEQRRHPEFGKVAELEVSCDLTPLVLKRRVTFDGSLKGFVERFGMVVLRHYNGFCIRKDEIREFGLSDEEAERYASELDDAFRQFHKEMVTFSRDNGYEISLPEAAEKMMTTAAVDEDASAAAFAWLCAVPA